MVTPTTVPRQDPTARGGPGRQQNAGAGPIARQPAGGVWAGSSPEDWATVFLAVLTVASAYGLRRSFSGSAWVWPVLWSIFLTHAGCWALRRRRVAFSIALPLSLVLLVLVISVTILHGSSWHGIPTHATWSQAREALRQSWRDFSLTQAPVVPTQGFELLAAGGAGLVAIAGDWMAFRRHTVLPAVVPAFAMFVVCCAAGQGRGRVLTSTVEVAALCAFLLARATAEREQTIWLGSQRRGSVAWALRAGVPMGAVAVVTALLIAPFPAGTDGHGALGWRGHNSERIVDDPTVDMVTQLLDPSDDPMFKVQTSYPSYWRLTTLATFTGDLWTSTGTYRSFGAKLPGTGALPPGTQRVEESFQIQLLDSPWLPDAFNPVSVRGLRGVTYDPVSDSLITKDRTSSSFDYVVTSYRNLASLHPTNLESAPAATGTTLRTYTQLPAGFPANVTSLAMSITAGKTNDYDKAMAIQRYLLSPPFSYSLRPTSDGSGTEALSNFLFYTHQGYCQQFAGAFAALARAVGVPTRIAVGFAQGTQVPGSHEYQVSEADAHSWPEVYFGPQYGWVPFEPTPGYANPASSSYETPATGKRTTPSAGNGAATPSQNSSTATTVPVGGSGKPAASPLLVPTGLSGGSGGTPVIVRILEVVGLIALLVLLWIPVNLLARRLRWRHRRRRASTAGPAGMVLADWAEVADTLAWRGVVRRQSETFDEFARRVVTVEPAADDESSQGDLAADVAKLALLADRAAFAAGLDPSATTSSSQLSGQVRRRLIRSAGGRQLMLWGLVPRPGPRPS